MKHSRAQQHTNARGELVTITQADGLLARKFSVWNNDHAVQVGWTPEYGIALMMAELDVKDFAND
jgi:hypothetical protein